MSKISQVNVANAHANPEGEFDAPADVVETAGLTRGEKIAVLERWMLLVQERLDASAEGMPASGTTDRDTALLEAVRVELVALEHRPPEG